MMALNKRTVVLIVMAMSLIAIVGCEGSEPSNATIEREFRRSLAREGFRWAEQSKVQVRKTGKGHWSIRPTARRWDGESRTLRATAVMDTNGNIHYYTD